MGLYVRAPFRNQNLPTVVCSALRSVLPAPPISRSSLKSRVQVADVSEGGGAGRNCAGLDMTQGRMAPTIKFAGITVGTYTPGWVIGRQFSGASPASSARDA